MTNLRKIRPRGDDVKGLLRHARNSFVDYWGHVGRRCPICGYSGRFEPAGRPYRIDARCKGCLSLERHRLLALVEQDQGIFGGREVLHFAPEPAVTALIRAARPARYDKSDYGDTTTLNLDLESVAQPDASWDVVVASHILEHVDDAKALAELRRIVRPDGAVVLMVPIVEGWSETYENDSVTTDAGRLLHFGQEDHVRFYGTDFRQRVETAGFRIEEHTATEPEVHTYALTRGEKVFVCKPV